MPLSSFWVEDALMATFIINLFLSYAIGCHLNLSSLHTFGYACYPQLRPYTTKKIGLSFKKCVFVIYNLQYNDTCASIQKPIMFIFLIISYLMKIHLPLLNLLPLCLSPTPLKFFFSLNRVDPQSSTSKASPCWPCLCFCWSWFAPKCSMGNTLTYSLLLHLLIIYLGLLLPLIHHLHSWASLPSLYI